MSIGSDCEDQVRTDVIDDVGELSEADLLGYGQPTIEEPEVTIETEELPQRPIEDSESSITPEIIYGSPEAVRYFQKVALPPGGTESTTINVEDLSARSKLVVRPLSLPDTYVDRHGSPGTRIRRTDFVVPLAPESEPEIQPESVPVPVEELGSKSEPPLETELTSDLELRLEADQPVPLSEVEPYSAEETVPATEEKCDPVLERVLKLISQSETSKSEQEQIPERESGPEVEQAMEQIMVSSIEQILESAIEQVLEPEVKSEPGATTEAEPEFELVSDQQSVPLSEAEPYSVEETIPALEQVLELISQPETSKSDQEQILERESSTDVEQAMEQIMGSTIEQRLESAIEQVLEPEVKSAPEATTGVEPVFEFVSVPASETIPVLEESSRPVSEPESDAKLVDQQLEATPVELIALPETESDSESSTSTQAELAEIVPVVECEETIPVPEESHEPVLEIKQESDLESVLETKYVPVVEMESISEGKLVLEAAPELREDSEDLLEPISSPETDSESCFSPEENPEPIPESNSIENAVQVQEVNSASVLEMEPESDLDPVLDYRATELEIGSDCTLEKCEVAKPEAVLAEESSLEIEAVPEVELVSQTASVVEAETVPSIVESEPEKEEKLVFEAELVLETEPVLPAEPQENPESDRTPPDGDVMEEVDEIYTEEEDIENKSHAARVASVLNDLHRPTPDESPLDERAERMAEAILASALFETVFLQPEEREEDRSSESTVVPESSFQSTDLPFIGSSFCRIQFPSTGSVNPFCMITADPASTF
ncbi:hypothetical protein DAPPUDRAFT_310447 [Daphnia pulex]|uniref:Uncharacterized protein n=1 Tax=Daphnia pulex TaxID=6669 RepID=E9FTP3_DAPPU|nr:hypothetical protein DAPPUDRAFT_310447 [Daphnia pulex]|eukprot:EFX89402.1 hypothetical protein DAPPUDRAFT_310447 [Daphnia pulex]